MRVSRLEIFGFKSFLDRLTLPLESGVTGVVGPNGCGKSNIVDAVRWVLGETRASNLRGGTLEDVIFNGTDKLRPLGLAEVTLTLRASENGFFADVQKDLRPFIVYGADERGAGQEIDLSTGQDDRFMGSHLSVEAGDGHETRRPHLTVISGALDTSIRDNENLASAHLSSDGIGEPISSLDKQEVERATFGHQEANDDLPGPDEEQPSEALLFSRFAWLKSLTEVQITRRLYRSGESEFFINRVQCRLRDIKDLFRVVGLGTRAYTIVAQGEVSRIVTSKPEERRLILEEAAGVAGFRDRISTARKRLEETDVNISRLDDVIKEVTRQVNSLRVQASRARNREQLKGRMRELGTVLFRDSHAALSRARRQASELQSQACGEEECASAALQRAQAEEQEGRGSLLSLDVEGDALRLKIDAVRDEMNVRSRKRSEFLMKTNEMRSRLDSLHREFQSLQDRKTIVQDRLTQIGAEIEGLRQEASRLGEQLESGAQGGEERLRVLGEQLAAGRRELRDKEEELRRLREKQAATRSRLGALEEQIAIHSPLQQLQRALNQLGIENAHGASPRGQEKLDLSRVPPERSRLIQALAGGAALFADGLNVPAHLTSAVQAVIAERAAYLVSDDAFGLAKAYMEETSLLRSAPSHSSKEILPLGVFSSLRRVACPEATELLAVPFPRLIDAISISEKCYPITAQLLDRVYIAETAEDAMSFFEKRGEEVGGCTLVTPRGEVVTAYSFVSLHQGGGLFQLRQEALALTSDVERLEGQIALCTVARTEAVARVDTLDQAQRQALSDLQAEQSRQREVSKELGSVKGRLQASERIQAQLGEDKRSIQTQEESNVSRRQSLELELATREQESQKETGDCDAKLEVELRELQGEYAVLDQGRKQRLEILSKLSSGTDEARRRCDEARREVSRLALETQKIEIECRTLHERVVSEYGETFWLSEVVNENMPVVEINDTDRSAFRDELARLRTRVAREGEVDSSSIERFEEEKARLENLEVQKKDLHDAAITLRRTIDQLRETSERRFLSMFKAVQENFSRIIPRLYGGGRGSIELTDPDAPLESGIDIIVRPPGKKLKSIELLSGGEKALCAIGLIVSIFSERPSPLCILDEVDAPLDEANLVRFLSVIKEMSNRTQFILVTHNKQSMAVADSLVGVTMQQPGASKVVTVSLQEAFAHVA